MKTRLKRIIKKWRDEIDYQVLWFCYRTYKKREHVLKRLILSRRAKEFTDDVNPNGEVCYPSPAKPWSEEDKKIWINAIMDGMKISDEERLQKNVEHLKGHDVIWNPKLPTPMRMG